MLPHAADRPRACSERTALVRPPCLLCSCTHLPLPRSAAQVAGHANVPLLLASGAMFLLGAVVVALVVRRWLRQSEYKDIP